MSQSVLPFAKVEAPKSMSVMDQEDEAKSSVSPASEMIFDSKPEDMTVDSSDEDTAELNHTKSQIQTHTIVFEEAAKNTVSEEVSINDENDISIISANESMNTSILSAEEKKALKEEKKRLREKQDAERQIKRQKLDQERQLKKEQQEKEKLEKQRKKEEEFRLKEERKQQLELEKQQKKEKLEEEKRQKELQRQQEKEEKERQKQLEKEEKEKQKQQEREERERQRQLEKEEKELQKQQEKEEKERQKQAEKEEKERQEKLKAEKLKRQQITSFFKIKTPSKTAADLSSSPVRVNSSPVKLNDAGFITSSPIRSIPTYKSYFVPFFVKANSSLIRILPDEEDIQLAKSEFDQFLEGKSIESKVPFLKTADETANRSLRPPTSFDVIQCMNTGLNDDAVKILEKVPHKYIHFYENLKQPYYGTISRTVLDFDQNIAIEPFTKITSDSFGLNYEYDSDLEEDEDDEEGDDVENDEEEEEEEEEEGVGSNAESDIDEFLEEDDLEERPRKKTIMGPLIPIASWAGKPIDEAQESSAAAKMQQEMFDDMQYERLHEKIKFPIDLMASYWDEPLKPAKPIPTNTVEVSTDKKLTVDSTGAIKDGGVKQSGAAASSAKKDTVNTLVPKKKVIISVAEDIVKLTDFVAQNNTFTMSTLSELAQKQVLPQYKKMVVKNTIQSIATFDNQKKEWIINGSSETQVVPAPVSAPVAAASE